MKKNNKVVKLENTEPKELHKSWGFLQTFLEYTIHSFVLIIPETFAAIGAIIAIFFILWWLLRLLNFIGLTKLFGKRFERFVTLKTSFNIPKTYKSAEDFSNKSKSKSRKYSSNEVIPETKKTIPKNNYLSLIKKLLYSHLNYYYFNFSGKINRIHFFKKIFLHLFLVDIPLSLIGYFAKFPLLILFSLIPSLSLSSRRMRDVGKSPFWLIIFTLITILAFVNNIFILIAFPFFFVLVFWLIKPSLKVGNIFK